MSVEVKLTEVSYGNALEHAFTFSSLARSERDFPTSANEGFLTRNRSALVSMKHVVRYARAEHLRVLSIGLNDKIYGVATVIGNTLIHQAAPDAKPTVKLRGYNLDYWLRHEADDGQHNDVAQALLEFSIAKATPGEVSVAHFATVRVDEPDLNRGFVAAMGEPLVRTRIYQADIVGGDPYGIAKDGELVDVHAYVEPFIVNP